MTTLVIHAPRSRVQADVKGFEDILRSRRGDEYAIYKNLFDRLAGKCGVVVLDKERGLHAEGKLEKLVPVGKTRSNVPRYNVHISKLAVVKYKTERLNRCGVSVID